MMLTWKRMPETHESGEAIYSLHFNSVLGFIEKYRNEVVHQKLKVPHLGEDLPTGPFRLHFCPPAYKGKMETRARILKQEAQHLELELAKPSARLKGSMEAYTDLCEAIWAECMELMGVQGQDTRPAQPYDEEVTAPIVTQAAPAAEAIPQTQSPPASVVISIPPTIQAPNAIPNPPAPNPVPEAPVAEEAAPEEAVSVEAAPTIEEDMQGELAETPAPLLLSQLALSQASGQLILKNEEREITLLLKKGWVVQATTGCMDRLRLGEMLVRAGELSEYDRDQAVDTCAKRGELLGQTLLRQKRITERTLQRILEKQAASQLIALRNWSMGTYELLRSEGRIERPLPRQVNPARVFYKRWTKNFAKRDPEEVANTERGLRNSYLVANEDIAKDIKLLALDPDEYALWRKSVENPTQLSNAYLNSPLSRRLTHGVIFAWKEMGLIHMSDSI